MFEPGTCRMRMYCIEESICDIVGTFLRPPQSFDAREIVPPLLLLCVQGVANLTVHAFVSERRECISDA